MIILASSLSLSVSMNFLFFFLFLPLSFSASDAMFDVSSARFARSFPFPYASVTDSPSHASSEYNSYNITGSKLCTTDYNYIFW